MKQVERTLLLERESVREREGKREDTEVIKRIHLEQVLTMIYLQQSTCVGASVII